jgi:hypothetical protein
MLSKNEIRNENRHLLMPFHRRTRDCLTGTQYDESFTWNFFVDDTNQDDNYDMIIGDDCLSAIGIDIIYSRGLIEWDDSAAPMHQEGEKLPDVQEIRAMQRDDEPHTSEAIKQTAERQTQILDAKYEKADLHQGSHIRETYILL